LVLIGGLVLAMRRKPAAAGAGESPSRRISDDESLRVSLAKTRAAVVRPIVAPPAPVVPAAVPAPVQSSSVDEELAKRVNAVAQNPQDLEANLNLLRLHHARGNAIEYEAAAQAMREQVHSTLDPRWREAVIMGAALMPGHALFNQAGWNAPRFEVPEPAARAVAAIESAPPAENAVPPVADVAVFDLPEEDHLLAAPVEDSQHDLPPDAHQDLLLDSSRHDFGHGGLDLMDAPGDLADAIPSASGAMHDDDASATRIELAKAYLDIGDLDGARSMLEEVLAEGSPAAQAEADRILREIG
jgi:pilus assembly protein FimV